MEKESEALVTVTVVEREVGFVVCVCVYVHAHVWYLTWWLCRHAQQVEQITSSSGVGSGTGINPIGGFYEVVAV